MVFIKEPSHPLPLRAVRLGRIIAVAFALFVAGVPRSSSGFVLEGPSWPDGSTVVFQLGLGDAGRTLLDGNVSWNSAVAPALDQWTQNIQRVRLSGMNGTSALSSGDGINSIVFTNSVFGQSFGANTLAITYYRYSGSRITEADVLFNQNQTFDSYRGPLRFGANGYAIGDIRRILVHELGHALGLAHPDQSGQNVDAIMNSVESNRETVSSDDIAGAQNLYGTPGSPSPTPTPTPAPTPTVPPSATTVTLTANPARVKTGGTATYLISASLVNTNSDITISYAMSGSAVLGTNYSLSGEPRQVTIPAGQSSATVMVRILSGRKNKGKTVIMNLISGAGYTVSTPARAPISITK